MSMMPQVPDNRPEQPVTEAPPEGAAPGPDGRVQTVDRAAVPNEDRPRATPIGDQPRRRNRRRRQHRRARLDAAAASGSTALAESPAIVQKTPTQQPAAEAPFPAATQQHVPTQPPTGTAPRRHRRRRRRRPRPEAARIAAPTNDPAAGATAEAVLASAATEPKEAGRDRTPRRRERDRIPHEERSRNGENRREQSRDPRLGQDRGGRARDDRGTQDKGGVGRPKHRRRGRDGDNFRKKPEPKLHRLETIVDRGFEDVTDPVHEGASRRADWTILKRTTADQRTARALSVVYVLRRDGVDTEFAHLSAARAAVNKTITHPEKLTLSKADHATARGAKK
jgi:hypothetical protein